MGKFANLFRRKYDRLFGESGGIHIEVSSVPDRLQKYLTDIFTTLIDIEWRWNLLIFFGSFALNWFVFAIFFFLLCHLHGDFEAKNEHPDWTPCVQNVQSFTSAFLFSIETMSTIGYGHRYITEACPGAYAGVFLQSVIGAGLQFALAGLVVAKIRRAKKRSITMVFSDTVCITKEDLHLQLMIRVGDIRKSDIIGAHARGFIIRKSHGKSGENVPGQILSVDFHSEGGGDRLFLPWPTYIIHTINDQSPLYNLSKEGLQYETFELLVILEGVASTLGKTFQVRKSYHPWEIKWGERFVPLGVTTNEEQQHIVNYEFFNATMRVDIPVCSAQELERPLDSASSIISSPPSVRRRRRSSCFEQLSIFRHRKSITDTGLRSDSEMNSDSESYSSDASELIEEIGFTIN